MIEQYIKSAEPSAIVRCSPWPWEIVQRLSENLSHYIETLGDEFTVHDGVAIHNTAVIAQVVAGARRWPLLQGRIVPVLPRNLRLSESIAKLV